MMHTIACMTTRGGNITKDQVVVLDSNATRSQSLTYLSYGTVIAFLDCDINIVLDEKFWDYSTTTLRYLKMFLDNYGELHGITKSDIQDFIDNGDIKVANLQSLKERWPDVI